MRGPIVVGVVIVTAAVLAIGRLPREPLAERGRLRAPTAEEEAGELRGPLEAGPRLVPRVRGPVSPHARSGDARIRAQGKPPSAAQDAAASTPGVPQEGGSVYPTPVRRMPVLAPRGHEERAGDVDESAIRQTAPSVAAQAGTPHRAAVFSAPVLIEGALAYPLEGYHVVLDRDGLTPRLRVEGARGRIVLRILVRADGSVGRVDIAETSGNRALDNAAVLAAAHWAFTPASRDGRPIEAWVIVPVRFVVP